MSQGPVFDFDAAVSAPFRMQPGLRRLADGARTLAPLTPGSAAFQQKLAVLQRDAGAALLCEPGFDARPAWRVLALEGAAQCPGVLAVGDEGVDARPLGWQVGWRVGWDGQLGTLPDGGGAPALQAGAEGGGGRIGDALHAAIGECLQRLPEAQRLPGLLSLALHEDFAIVDGATGTLQALAVCLPSHWAPEEKIGRSFAAVHGPVADNATLVAAGQHLMRLVCQPQRWERFVWNITAQGHHDMHPRRHPKAGWPEDAGALIASAHWRTEQQSFIPLLDRQQAVFIIHVDVQPLAAAIDRPERAAALHASLASMSPAVLEYRGLTVARDPLLDWLAHRMVPGDGASGPVR